MLKPIEVNRKLVKHSKERVNFILQNEMPKFGKPFKKNSYNWNTENNKRFKENNDFIYKEEKSFIIFRSIFFIFVENH